MTTACLRALALPTLLGLFLFAPRVEAQPVSDTCAGAEVIPASGPFPLITNLVDTIAATSAADPIGTCVTSTHYNRGIWWSFTPAASGTYLFRRVHRSLHPAYGRLQ